MKIKQANIEQFEIVKSITKETIKEVYPHYYPEGAVEFFLSHHCDRNISKDIQSGQVFLIFNEKEEAVGTVTMKENEICRLFVLPHLQKRGFGGALLKFAEDMLTEHYETITLDASLPAKAIYLKRGYVETETHSIQTEGNDYLCYDVMKKNVSMK